MVAAAGCTFKSDDIVVKSPNDRRLYRVIELDNGLCALLVHDPEIYPQCQGPLHDSKTLESKEEEEDEEEDEDEEEADDVDDGDEEEEEDSEGEDDEEDGEYNEVKANGNSSQTKKVKSLLFYFTICEWSQWTIWHSSCPIGN